MLINFSLKLSQFFSLVLLFVLFRMTKNVSFIEIYLLLKLSLFFLSVLLFVCFQNYAKCGNKFFIQIHTLFSLCYSFHFQNQKECSHRGFFESRPFFFSKLLFVILRIRKNVATKFSFKLSQFYSLCYSLSFSKWKRSDNKFFIQIKPVFLS